MKTITNGRTPRKTIEIEPLTPREPYFVTVRCDGEMATTVFAAAITIQIHHFEDAVLLQAHAFDLDGRLIAISWTDEIAIDDHCVAGVKIEDRYYDEPAAAPEAN